MLQECSKVLQNAQGNAETALFQYGMKTSVFSGCNLHTKSGQDFDKDFVVDGCSRYSIIRPPSDD